MVESMSDIVSLLSLCAFPFIMLIMLFLSMHKKHKAKLIASREQYYREW